MADALDAFDLADGKRVAIVTGGAGLTAVPQVADGNGRWRRAHPGDGVATALLDVLSRGSTTRGGFTLRSWTSRSAHGERTVGVDQTNESVIVGDVAVVKWATHLQEGPHPAPRRLGLLRAAGFDGMPTAWGLLAWRTPDGTETLVANVDDYLPGAVDGWTWAVDLVAAAAEGGDATPYVAAASAVGTLTADLHTALSCTTAAASAEDVRRWRDGAFAILETACFLRDFVRTRRNEAEAALAELDAFAGTPILEGHGDLHVGQILLSAGRFVVTDFDGNPVLAAPERMLPIPAALDVAGMTQSMSHAAIVAAKHAPLDATALAEVDTAGRAAFLTAYTRGLSAVGHADLHEPRLLRPLRIQQVLREIIYAARHLPQWMYVPEAALPAVLEEGIPP